MDENNSSANQEPRRPNNNRHPRNSRPQHRNTSGEQRAESPTPPRLSGAPLSTANQPTKATNQNDRFSRPSLSRHGARIYTPAGQDPERSANTNNRTGRSPAARNPRLNQDRPVYTKPNPVRNANADANGGNGQRLNRRRFSDRPQNANTQNNDAVATSDAPQAQTETPIRTDRPQRTDSTGRPQRNDSRGSSRSSSSQPRGRYGRGRSTERPSFNKFSSGEEVSKPMIIGKAMNGLRIIPLGGAGETGDRNMTIFEYGNDIVVVDCGIMFAKPEMLGVDSVIPDTRYLEARKQNIRGMVFTHGHEDHIGAVAHIWPKLGCPIYATPLTNGLIKHKFDEAGISDAKLTVIDAGDKLHFGQISIEMVRLTHSIPDVLGLAIRCPAGLFFYATDWRLEHTPALGKPADWIRIAQLGGEGITALFSDSTNVDRPGYSPTEKNIGDAFDRVFADAPGRIIVAQFSSQINRIQQVLNSSKKFGRKVALSGRSMETYVNIALGLGYLKFPEGMLIDLRKANSVDPKKLVIMSTGSQGEEFSSLTRISEGEHRHIKLDKNDTVVISASAIPGNEPAVDRMIDNLYKEGANVIHNKIMSDIHVSGHPSREELKMMFALTQPKYFIPIHGDYHRMVEHGKLAVEMGVDADNVLLMQNGNVVNFDDKGGRITEEKLELEDVMIDGLGIGDVGSIIIRERQSLGEEGMVTIFLVVKKNGELVNSPDIVSRGFIYMRSAEDFMHKLREEIKRAYAKALEKHGTNWDEVKNELRDEVFKFLNQNTGREPMVLPVITTV